MSTESGSMVSPPNPSTVWDFFQTAAPIASAITSIVLAGLYYFQFNTLEEQRKLSKANQCPYLTGPYHFTYDRDEQTIWFEVTNAGNGAAIDVELVTSLELTVYEGELHEGQTTVTGHNRDESGEVFSSEIQPRESNVRISKDADEIYVGIISKSIDFGEDFRELGDMILFLQDEGIEEVCIRFQVRYKDQFGESKDPFDREYTMETPVLRFDPDDADRESVLNSYYERYGV